MSNTIGYSLGCVTPVRYNLTQGEDATGNSVSFSLPSCAPPPIGDEEVTLSAISSSSTPTLIGFSEWTSPSSPPKKYLRNTIFLDYEYYVVPTGGCGDCSRVVEKNTFFASGYSYYDPVTGILQALPILRGGPVYAPGCTPPALAPNGSFSGEGLEDANIFQLTSQTQTHRTFDIYSACHEFSPGTSVMCINRGSTRDLSIEDTEDNAIARAVWVTGGGTVAFRTLRTTGFSFDLTTVEAVLNCSNLHSELRYKIRYDVKETNLTTLEETLTAYEVEVPEFSTSYASDTIVLSPEPGSSLEVVNYNIFTL